MWPDAMYQHVLRKLSVLTGAGRSNWSYSRLGLSHKSPKYLSRRYSVVLGTLPVALLVIFAVSAFSNTIRGENDISSHELNLRQELISAAFSHAWDGYSRYCFGHDTLKPVSNTCEDDFGGWGASAIDSISTAIIMGKEDAAEQILHLIATLDLHRVVRGSTIQVFEVTIRHFAGMISAWDLLNGPFSHMVPDPNLRNSLYSQMVTLGDILSCSFDKTSGIPHDWVDPRLCEAEPSTSTSTAGVGTMMLEFARLSAITGNQTYVDLAERAEDYLLRPRTGEAFPGLLGSHVSTSSGDLLDSSGSWGAFADSFYEYLIKAYIYDSTSYGLYLERWLLAVDSTIRHIASHPYGHPEWIFLPSWGGSIPMNRMETLSWFAGGNFILGGMVTKNQTILDFGLSIADAAGAVYRMTATGLGGEFVTWISDCEDGLGGNCNATNSIRTTNGRYNLRPEVLETWYYAYRATKNLKYREWSWAAFKAINQYCRTDSGFSSITNVDAIDGGSKTDKQESFVYAEVLKYLYLIHLEDEGHPFHVQDSRSGSLNGWVYNTEAHPIKIKGPPV